MLDPAQQRFYLFAIYIALWAYRSYDFYTLAVEDDESLWLCLKWCFFDMLFMFGVPLLEIPWLEWSNGAAFLLFVVLDLLPDTPRFLRPVPDADDLDPVALVDLGPQRLAEPAGIVGDEAGGGG